MDLGEAGGGAGDLDGVDEDGAAGGVGDVGGEGGVGVRIGAGEGEGEALGVKTGGMGKHDRGGRLDADGDGVGGTGGDGDEFACAHGTGQGGDRREAEHEAGKREQAGKERAHWGGGRGSDRAPGAV